MLLYNRVLWQDYKTVVLALLFSPIESNFKGNSFVVYFLVDLSDFSGLLGLFALQYRFPILICLDPGGSPIHVLTQRFNQCVLNNDMVTCSTGVQCTVKDVTEYIEGTCLLYCVQKPF